MKYANIILGCLLGAMLLVGFSSCRGERHSDQPIKMKKNSDRKSFEKLSLANRKFERFASGAFAKYTAGDDQSFVYDHDRNLELNFWSTSKSGRQPLIVFLPPGGFLQYDKDEPMTRFMCREFARAGFNTASVSYSLISKPRWSELTKEKLLVYARGKIADALADVSHAIDYLQENNNSQFGFDENEIYLVGYSAGAVLALHTVFTDEGELNDYIDGDYRVGYTRPSAVKKVVAISGALLSEHFDDSDLAKTPLLMIHGDQDQTVPMGYGKVHQDWIKDVDIDLPGIIYSIKMMTNSGQSTQVEGFHTSFHLPKWLFKYSIGAAVPKVFGSQAIYDSAVKNTRLVKIEGGNHVFMVKEGGTLNHTYRKMRKQILNFLNR